MGLHAGHQRNAQIQEQIAESERQVHIVKDIAEDIVLLGGNLTIDAILTASVIEHAGAVRKCSAFPRERGMMGGVGRERTERNLAA